MGIKGSSVCLSVCHRRSLASRPEVIDSLRMEDPVQEAEGQVQAGPSGQLAALKNPNPPLAPPFSPSALNAHTSPLHTLTRTSSSWPLALCEVLQLVEQHTLNPSASPAPFIYVHTLFLTWSLAIWSLSSQGLLSMLHDQGAGLGVTKHLPHPWLFCCLPVPFSGCLLPFALAFHTSLGTVCLSRLPFAPAFQSLPFALAFRLALAFSPAVRACLWGLPFALTCQF